MSVLASVSESEGEGEHGWAKMSKAERIWVSVEEGLEVGGLRRRLRRGFRFAGDI